LPASKNIIELAGNCVAATYCIMLSFKKNRQLFLFVRMSVPEEIFSYLAAIEYLIQEQESGIQKSAWTGLFKPAGSQVCQRGS
jgi:hypothetical protein